MCHQINSVGRPVAGKVMGRPSDYDSNCGYESHRDHGEGIFAHRRRREDERPQGDNLQLGRTYTDVCDALRVLKWERDLHEAKDTATVRLACSKLQIRRNGIAAQS